MKSTFRAGGRARHTRYELVERTGLPRETVDRLALAAGVRSLAGRPPTSDDDDDRGDRHERAPLTDIGQEGLVEALLEGLGIVPSAPEDGGTDLGLRRALNRGYSELREAMAGLGATWHGVLGRLLAELENEGREPGAEGVVGPVVVELGRFRGRAAEPVRWCVNDEGGRANNANTRIAGASGKGKTQVLLHLLAGIAEQSPDTGAFVFDYKGDIAGNDDFVQHIGARVLDPARSQPIPVNPFELPGELPPTIAASSFAEVFASFATGIGPVQRHLLSGVMLQCFEHATAAGRAGPTLRDIRRAVQERYREEGRTDDSVIATFARIADLGLFADRTMDTSELLRRRWILKLDALGPFREVVAFAVIEYLHNLANALRDAPFANERHLRRLRTVVVVDEAHYYLRGRCDGLLGLVRIGRSKGMPVMLSSQSLEDYRRHTELEELFANTLVFGHGKPPGINSLRGALAVGSEAAKRAAEQVTRLEQFEVFTNIAGERSARALRCHPFFERSTAGPKA